MRIAQKQKLWENWTRELIYADRGIYAISPRHHVMREFIEKGLFPLVRSKGYIFQKDPKGVYISFLRYLFAIHNGEKVKFTNPHKNIYSDHFDDFEHRFDTIAMEPFWKKWGVIQDFDDGQYAEKVKYVLPYFIWACINLEDSPAYEKLENLFDELDEMENIQGIKTKSKSKSKSKGKDDPYLGDYSNSYLSGYRHRDTS